MFKLNSDKRAALETDLDELIELAHDMWACSATSNKRVLNRLADELQMTMDKIKADLK